MATDETAVADRARGGTAVDHRRTESTLWIPATWICQGRSTCPRYTQQLRIANSSLSSATGSDEHGNGGGSLGSSVDGEDAACASPRTRAPYTSKVVGDASQVGSEAPILKLFGKKVVVEDLKADSLPASAVQATRNGNPIGAAGAASPWNPWPGSVQVQQLMYLVPQPDGFAAAQPAVPPWFGYNGNLPCAVFYPQPQAVAASPPEHQQQQQQQASEPLDQRRTQREGSLTGSNMAASSAAASAAQNLDTAESHQGGAGQENISDGCWCQFGVLCSELGSGL